MKKRSQKEIEYQLEWKRKKRLDPVYRAKEALISKAYYSKADRKEKSFAWGLNRRYGITKEQYQELLDKQNGCCAVCKRHASDFKRRLSVDHDHAEFGQVRGLLCFKCNKILVGTHTKDTVQAVHDYLHREYTGWIVPPKIKRKKGRKRIR